MVSLDDVKYIVDKFFEMCRSHPEICPHDLEYSHSRDIELSRYKVSSGIKEVVYKCKLCGSEFSKYAISEEYSNSKNFKEYDTIKECKEAMKNVKS